MLNRYGVFDEMFDIFRDFDSLFRRTLGDVRAWPEDTGAARQLPAGVASTALTHGSPRRSAMPGSLLSWATTFQPAVSCFTRDNQLVVRAELAGVSPDDIEVNVAGDRLIIRGEKKDQQEVKEADVHFMEISHGRFERSFGLPEGVKKDQVRASFSNGVLEVTMPAQEVEAARKVPIETSGTAPKAIKAA